TVEKALGMTTHKLYPSVRVFPTPSHPTAARPLYEVPPLPGGMHTKKSHSHTRSAPFARRRSECWNGTSPVLSVPCHGGVKLAHKKHTLPTAKVLPRAPAKVGPAARRRRETPAGQSGVPGINATACS